MVMYGWRKQIVKERRWMVTVKDRLAANSALRMIKEWRDVARVQKIQRIVVVKKVFAQLREIPPFEYQKVHEYRMRRLGLKTIQALLQHWQARAIRRNDHVCARRFNFRQVKRIVFNGLRENARNRIRERADPIRR